MLRERYVVIRCAEKELETLDEKAVLRKKITPYGAEAIVRRDAIPRSVSANPVTIEELFVHMVKEER